VSGHRSFVVGARGRRGSALGEEDRPGKPAAEKARKKVGGAGGPVHVVDRPALAHDRGPVGVEVEVANVELQDLTGAAAVS